MIAKNFKQQVELLLEILSDVVYDDHIALKGGTAINLFGIAHQKIVELKIQSIL